MIQQLVTVTSNVGIKACWNSLHVMLQTLNLTNLGKKEN